MFPLLNGSLDAHFPQVGLINIFM